MFVLNARYEILETDNKFLRKNLEQIKQSRDQQYDLYEKQIAELTAKIEQIYSAELEECDFEFDFKSADAFSIERINKSGKNKTIIGYRKTDEGTIGEWWFDCSFAQHQKLAEQFRKYSKK
jgi:hypothetical protein